MRPLKFDKNSERHVVFEERDSPALFLVAFKGLESRRHTEVEENTQHVWVSNKTCFAISSFVFNNKISYLFFPFSYLPTDLHDKHKTTRTAYRSTRLSCQKKSYYLGTQAFQIATHSTLSHLKTLAFTKPRNTFDRHIIYAWLTTIWLTRRKRALSTIPKIYSK